MASAAAVPGRGRTSDAVACRPARPSPSAAGTARLLGYSRRRDNRAPRRPGEPGLAGMRSTKADPSDPPGQVLDDANAPATDEEIEAASEQSDGTLAALAAQYGLR